MKKKKKNKLRLGVVKKPKADEMVHQTRMKIIGIGGGGGSIVSEIVSQIQKVDFVAANTDFQALRQVSRGVKLFHFGQNITHGLGCGMDVKIGQKAAREEKEKIVRLFKNVDLAVIVASLGGGTGSGAAPEFARIAKELGVITLGIFTTPFKFEGGKRIQVAKNSLERLVPFLNTLTIIPNENIFKIIDKQTSIKGAFSAINKRLADNLRGIIEMVYLSGLINIDFADLKTILEGRGKLAYLNSALAQGANRAEEVVKEVLKSPLNEYGIEGAEKIIFNITASMELKMQEVEKISRPISDFNRRAKIIFGVSQSSDYKDKIRLTLLAVGCGKEPKEQKKKKEPLPPANSEPSPQAKSKAKPQTKPKSKPKPKIKIKPIADHSRRNALELKKATEKDQDNLLSQESQWDIPAFLRKKQEE